MKHYNKHLFHVLEPSLWPFFFASGIFFFITGLAFTFQYVHKGIYLIGLGLCILFFISIFWLLDISRGVVSNGDHSQIVRKGIKLGFLFFIVYIVSFNIFNIFFLDNVFHKIFLRRYPGYKLPLKGVNIDEKVNDYKFKYYKDCYMNKEALFNGTINMHQYFQCKTNTDYYWKACMHHMYVKKDINIFTNHKSNQIFDSVSSNFKAIVISSGEDLVHYEVPSQLKTIFSSSAILANANSMLTYQQAQHQEFIDSKRILIQLYKDLFINLAKRPLLIPSLLIDSEIFIHEVLENSGFHIWHKNINLEILKSQNKLLELYQNESIPYVDLSFVVSKEKYEELSESWDNSDEKKKAKDEDWNYLKNINTKYED